MALRSLPARRRPRALLALAGLLSLSACNGVGWGAPEWIGTNAAVVRCTVSGPNLSLPQLFMEVPTVDVPTGLYARAMDPIALDQLGFERDRSVCASLQAPDAAQLDATQQAIDELITARNDLAKRSRKLGRCLCNYADALDARTLIPGCGDQPTQRNCPADAAKVAELDTLLAPLREKIQTTYVPRIHWRLSGRTDRRGRFVARYEELLGRHPGGSEVYLPNAALPPHPGMSLISGLLAEKDVVAVVRQDSGRAVLVVREIGRNRLILDHFAYPDWLAADVRGVDVELSTLLHHLDDAQLSRYREALKEPEQRRDLMFNPRKGYLVELDHAALERVDRAVLLATYFAGHRYDEAEEIRVTPPLLADRFAHQVPYGTDGVVLDAKLRLTEQGSQWLTAATAVEAYEALGSLGEIDVMPEFRSATNDGIIDLFLLRGQAIEQSLFAGVSAMPKVLFAVELAATNSVGGTVDKLSVDLPSGPLPGEFLTRPQMGSLRERLSKDPHKLTVELVDDARELSLELAPR